MEENDRILSPEEFKQRMLDLVDNPLLISDIGLLHYGMDKEICALLKTLGYEDGIKIFERTPKWWE